MSLGAEGCVSLRKCAYTDVSQSYEDAIPQKNSNYWSSTENSSGNAWNVNFNSGNVNNNNKSNGLVSRAVSAYHGCNCEEYERLLGSMYEAYHDCMKGKSSSKEALAYMSIAEEDIPKLAMEVYLGTYKPGASTCFIVKYPKWREVFAANFRDRIVHHWICLRLNPLFEERFISIGDVSFNCRKGYGTDMAVRDLADGMKRVSGGYRKKAWVFRGDLVGFFMSIDKNILWSILERFVVRWRKRYEREGWERLEKTYKKAKSNTHMTTEMPEMFWDILLGTTKTVVMHHPELDCKLNSPECWWKNLEQNKSLFSSETGEPIGNLTTQLFANFMMSYLSMYITHLYFNRNFHYVQFVDDFSIVCDDVKFIMSTIPKIEKFLSNTLHLKLHKDKRYIQPVAHGLLFVGTYVKPGRMYLSSRTLARFTERCEGFRRLMESRPMTSIDIKRIETVVNSYMGFCKGRETYRKRRKIIDGMGKMFWRYFYVKGRYKSIRAKRKYRLPCLTPFSCAAA